jgi:hypothetical protein
VVDFENAILDLFEKNRITIQDALWTVDLLDTDCLAFVVIFYYNSKEIFGLFQSQKYEAFL